MKNRAQSRTAAIDATRTGKGIEAVTDTPSNEVSGIKTVNLCRVDRAISARFSSHWELSQSSCVITSLSPGDGETMSKHTVRGGNVAGLLVRFSWLRERALSPTERHFPIIVIQEGGLNGFWIHRVLQAEGMVVSRGEV